MQILPARFLSLRGRVAGLFPILLGLVWLWDGSPIAASQPQPAPLPLPGAQFTPPPTPVPTEAVVLARPAEAMATTGEQYFVGLYLAQLPEGTRVDEVTFRVYYPSDAVKLEAIGSPPGYKIEVLSKDEPTTPTEMPDLYAEFQIRGDFPETPSVRNAFTTLRFRILDAAPERFTIRIGALSEEQPLLADAHGNTIPVRVNDTYLWDIELKLGDVAIVRPWADPAGPYAPGSEFGVRVRIAENPTGQNPIACSFRVYYDPEAVEFLRADTAQLGQNFIGPVHENTDDLELPAAYREIATMGDFHNEDPTPEAFNARFRVLEDASAGPFRVLVLTNPRTRTPLVGPHPNDAIAHRYDNARLQDLAVGGE